MRFQEAQTTWTRWFNFHSKAHMLKRYPEAWDWMKEQTKPIYLQAHDPDIPWSLTFPRQDIQEHFGYYEADGSFVDETFFNCSASWLLAFAIMERFQRIELWGIEVARPEFAFERPCIAYWIGRARQAGINVFLPENVTLCKAPSIYGYETT